MLSFVVIVIMAGTFSQALNIHRVTNIYGGTKRRAGDRASDWLSLRLDRDILNGRNATLQRVHWCASLQPNKAKARELRDCSQRGLLHSQFYPSTTPKTRFSGNTVYINPEYAALGTHHQAQIVLEADILDPRAQRLGEEPERLVHTFKLNPLYIHNIAMYYTDNDEDDTKIIVPPQIIPISENSAPAVGDVTFPHVGSETGDPIVSPVAGDNVHRNFTGMLTVLGVGMLVVALAGYAGHAVRNNRPIVPDTLRSGGRSLMSVLRGQGVTPIGEFHMLMTDDDDDVVVVEDDNNINNDIEILMQMGPRGANSAFARNL